MPMVMVEAPPTHSIVQKHLGCTTSHCLAYGLLMLPSWCYMMSQLFWHFWTCQGLWWWHPQPIPLFKNLWVVQITLWWCLWATVLPAHLLCCHHSATCSFKYSNTSERCPGYWWWCFQQTQSLEYLLVAQVEFWWHLWPTGAYTLVILPVRCYILLQIFKLPLLQTWMYLEVSK